MNIPDDLAAELPAPRDDEPPALRRRIVAELRDHLQCAFQRELVKTGDETEATRRVLKSFGKPARLARKLWFEAMQEKIMSQRIVVGLSAVLAFACLGMGGVALRIAQQTAEQSADASRALVEKAQEANRLLVEQGRELNAALIERLGRRDSDAPAAKTPERTRFKIRLVQGTADGPAAVGCRVFLGENEGRPQGLMNGNLLDYSGPAGTVDCGLLLPGSYRLSVTTAGNIGMTREIYIRLQELDQMETVICPVDDPIAERQVAISVNWPEDLRSRRLGVVCGYYAQPARIGGEDWSCGGGHDGHRYSSDPNETKAWTGNLLVSTDGCVTRIGGLTFSGNSQPGVKGDRAKGLNNREQIPESRLRLKGIRHDWWVIGIVFPSDSRTGEFGDSCPFVRSNEKGDSHDIVDTGVTTIPISFSEEFVAKVRQVLRELEPPAESSD